MTGRKGFYYHRMQRHPFSGLVFYNFFLSIKLESVANLTKNMWRAPMSRVCIYAANQLHECELEEGQTVSFLFLPEGRQTRPGKEQRVAHATVEKVGGHTVIARYQTNGTFLKNRLTTRRVVILRRMRGTATTVPAYRVDDYVAGLDLNPQE